MKDLGYYYVEASKRWQQLLDSWSLVLGIKNTELLFKLYLGIEMKCLIAPSGAKEIFRKIDSEISESVSEFSENAES